MKAYTKDVIRTIIKGKKRFFAIMLIAALGVCMLTGLKASCEDLRYSADKFFDKQNLFDISVVSTLGLTEEDVEVLLRLDGVEDAEGTYSETVFTTHDGKMKQAIMQVLSERGINVPYLLDGEMPQKADEILVTEKYLTETGKEIGDTIVIEEDMDSDSDIKKEEFKSDTEDINKKNGVVKEITQENIKSKTNERPEWNTSFNEETENKTSDIDSDEERESKTSDSENKTSNTNDFEIEIEEEEETPNFLYTTYTIVGVVIDITDINSNEGAVAFRSNSTTDYTFFILPEAVSSDVYTAVYLTLNDCDELLCYSEEYEEQVDEIVDILEAEIKEDREKVRYDKITGEALEKIEDAESEMNDKFSEAEEEIDSAKTEIADGWIEIFDGEIDLEKGERELAKAERELQKAQRQLERAERELDFGEKEIEKGEAELKAGEQELAQAEAELKAGEEQLIAGEEELKAGEEQLASLEQMFVEAKDLLTGHYPVMKELLLTQIEDLEQKISENEDGLPTEFEQRQLETYKEALQTLEEQEKNTSEMVAQLQAELEKGKAELEAGRVQLEEGKAELEKGRMQLEEGKIELEDARKELEQGKAELEAGKKEIADGWEEVEKGWVELEKAREELEEGKDSLEEGKNELEEGEQELAENVSEYEDKKAEALELIADAREEIAELKMTEWYISTRTSLSGYGNIKTDAGCIEAIGNAFPIIFLTIAILISLTTITRMVEEDRGLIGTYKALGFTDSEIRRKYLIYALLACLFGGILGDLMGFVLLPNIIFIIFGVMYQIPAYSLTFNYFYGIGGIVLFIIGIAGASIVSCEAELSHMPAMLMRPKAPRNGSRVFLERITPVWSRLSFLNKVTARNLFRYKKRLFMTLFGIAGCTALLICGFTIKDTVTGLMPRQYEDTYQYDIMAVAEDNDKLLEYLEDNNAVRKYMNTLITNVKLINEEGKEETVQLIVLPDGMSMKSYIRLYNKAGDNLTLSEEDVFATINVSKVLGFEKEDMITIQNLQLELADVEITEIAMNYLGNNVYMTQAKYEELFGTFEPNGALILLRGEEEEQEAFAQELAEKDGMLSAISTSSLKEDFEPAFQIINLVVYVVIVLAAALAFVVLFTLATTNISERERELATIKVLGFFDNEVHAYVNKETLILTGLGILCGLPAGNLLGTWLMSILNLPSIYFATTIYPISYVISGVIAICFALIVNTITDRSLNKINPVEALKSVE